MCEREEMKSCAGWVTSALAQRCHMASRKAAGWGGDAFGRWTLSSPPRSSHCKRGPQNHVIQIKPLETLGNLWALLYRLTEASPEKGKSLTKWTSPRTSFGKDCPSGAPSTSLSIPQTKFHLPECRGELFSLLLMCCCFVSRRQHDVVFRTLSAHGRRISALLLRARTRGDSSLLRSKCIRRPKFFRGRRWEEGNALVRLPLVCLFVFTFCCSCLAFPSLIPHRRLLSSAST